MSKYIFFTCPCDILVLVFRFLSFIAVDMSELNNENGNFSSHVVCNSFICTQTTKIKVPQFFQFRLPFQWSEKKKYFMHRMQSLLLSIELKFNVKSVDRFWNPLKNLNVAGKFVCRNTNLGKSDRKHYDLAVIIYNNNIFIILSF